MVQELRVHEAPQGRSWEEKVALWQDLVFDEIPLPQEFVEEQLEAYAALRLPTTLEEKVRLEWEAYLLAATTDWDGDPRSPRERLEEYFA